MSKLGQLSAPAAIEVLIERQRRHASTVGIIGLGYVGLPLALAACRSGFNTVGFDIDPDKVAQVNAGSSYIGHVPSDAVAFYRHSAMLAATSDFRRLAEVDSVLICVPTPLTRNREPDLSYIEATGHVIAAQLRRGQLVVLESTTFPGTTTGVMRPILECSGLKSGTDFFLAYSPEREDPGNQTFSGQAIPKVVSGDGETATRLAVALYREIFATVVPVSSPNIAEAVKLTENVFRAVNIALVNELKMLFERMDIDVWEIIDAAKTKPYGFMPFYPGPGMGGHCIPVDPFYLSWKAREYDISSHFIEAAGEINARMPQYVVDRIAQALNDRFARSLNAARILILGIAYKKNVADTRESPALRICELLERRGAEVDYHDPFVPEIPAMRHYSRLAGRRSLPLLHETFSRCDAVVICTDHDGLDYAQIVAGSKLVVDTRNATRGVDRRREVVVMA